MIKPRMVHWDKHFIAVISDELQELGIGGRKLRHLIHRLYDWRKGAKNGFRRLLRQVSCQAPD